MVKIVVSEKDIDSLLEGDQYIVQPEGVDFTDPESLLKHADAINALHDAIEARFKTKKVKK